MAAQLPAIGALLKALCNCRQQKNLPYAQHLLDFVLRHNLESHPAVGNHFVPTLVECGSLAEAHLFFNKLPLKNRHSWTSLLSGYVAHRHPHDAFFLFHQMREHQVQPHSHVFVALLQACVMLKDVELGAEMHAIIVKHGFLESDLFVANSLICMYSKCGALAEAHQVLVKLHVQDAVSWNTLIAGYVEHGHCKDALCCFREMQQEGLSLDAVTVICTLKSCGIEETLETGRELHMELVKRGLERDVPVGNTLLDMYGKCGSPTEACCLFDKLVARDAVSWTALIAAHGDCGLGEEALNFFEQAYIEGILLDHVLSVCSLKACASLGATDKGQWIHTEIIKRGLEEGNKVGTTLLDMYAKCNSLVEARKLFSMLPARDAVAWATLCAGYIGNGLDDEVLKCFKQMQKEGAPLSDDLFASSLKACAIIGDLETGQEVHGEVTKRGLERELCVGTELIGMYTKFGLPIEAREAIERLAVHDAILWAILISGYAESGCFDDVLITFEKIQLDGISPVADSYACSLKACCIFGAFALGRELHLELTKKGLERELCVSTAVVDIYAKCNSIVEARKVFDRLPVRDVVLWTALISGYADHEFGEEALSHFGQMQMDGVSPNAHTYASALKACSTVGALATGQETLAESTKRGLERELFVSSATVDMYAACGSIAEASEVFDNCARDVASWNAMIKGYGENHEGNLAMQCFEGMTVQGLKPNAITFTCLLTACSHSSLLTKGRQYFELMREKYALKETLEHSICMVDLHARSGHVHEAEKFAKALQCLSSEAILKALLSACKTHGKVAFGERCFQQLLKANHLNTPASSMVADICASVGRWADVTIVET